MKKPVRRGTGEVELNSLRTRRRPTQAPKAPKAPKAQTSSMVTHENHVCEDETLDHYSDRALFEYGSYVVEDRAIPELRDGLKPSHRAMLYSALIEGAVQGAAPKKAAKVTGTAIGAFHPHGDKAVYEAGVTTANYNPPLIEGIGNFGTPIDNPAAQRYTEMRVSKFSQLFMVDRGYMNVVPMIDNYSEDMKWPLYLPALLPTMLLCGNPTIPAYGVRAGNPAFEFDGVVALALHGLRGKEITDALCVKYLLPKHNTGALCVSNAQDIASLITTGRGSLRYVPRMQSDWKNKRIIIQSYCPTSLSGSTERVERTMRSIANLDGVGTAYDNSGEKNKDAGPYGAAMYVTMGRGVTEDRFYELAVEIRDKILAANESYALGVTIRQAGKKTIFKYLTFSQYLSLWVQYRINLEKRFQQFMLDEASAKLHIVNGKLKICGTRDATDKAIQIIRTSEDPKAKLMAVFKLDELQVDAILSMQLRSIAKLAVQELQKLRASLNEEIRLRKENLKKPGEVAAQDLRSRVKQYLAKPDITASRIPISGT